MSGIFDTGIFDTGIFDSTVGTFDTGIFDRNIYDNVLGPVTVAPSTAVAAGGYWPNVKRPEYRIHPEYDPDAKPKRKRKKKRKQEEQEIVILPAPVFEPKIITVSPALDVLSELQRIADEAARANAERLRAIAIADDEWLMMA